MALVRVLGAFAGLLLAVACSDHGGSSGNASPPAKPAPDAPKPLAPEPPEQVPGLPTTSDRDADGNQLDDVLDQQLLTAGSDQRLLNASVRIEVVLNAPLEQRELDEFV